MEEPGFWDDPEVSQQVMKELKGLQDSVKEIEKLYSDYEDMMLLIEMSEEEDSEETAEEIEEELQQFEETFEELRIGTLLTGPYDRDNAIVTLHAAFSSLRTSCALSYAALKAFHVEGVYSSSLSAYFFAKST